MQATSDPEQVIILLPHPYLLLNLLHSASSTICCSRVLQQARHKEQAGHAFCNLLIILGKKKI